MQAYQNDLKSIPSLEKETHEICHIREAMQLVLAIHRLTPQQADEPKETFFLTNDCEGGSIDSTLHETSSCF